MNPFWAGNPAGIGQQTRAAQLITATASGNGMRRAPKRRKARAARPARAARAARKPRARKARLVKGSAAAKRYMASIRRKRRK